MADPEYYGDKYLGRSQNWNLHGNLSHADHNCIMEMVSVTEKKNE